MNEDKLGTLEEAIEFDKKRNYQYTVPVAWIINGHLFEEYFKTSELDKIIPLYPSPRELSDDEIRKVIDGTWWVGTEEEIRFKIAKAVLEKASEK